MVKMLVDSYVDGSVWDVPLDSESSRAGIVLWKWSIRCSQTTIPGKRFPNSLQWRPKVSFQLSTAVRDQTSVNFSQLIWCSNWVTACSFKVLITSGTLSLMPLQLPASQRLRPWHDSCSIICSQTDQYTETSRGDAGIYTVNETLTLFGVLRQNSTQMYFNPIYAVGNISSGERFSIPFRLLKHVSNGQQLHRNNGIQCPRHTMTEDAQR